MQPIRQLFAAVALDIYFNARPLWIPNLICFNGIALPYPLLNLVFSSSNLATDEGLYVEHFGAIGRSWTSDSRQRNCRMGQFQCKYVNWVFTVSCLSHKVITTMLIRPLDDPT